MKKVLLILLILVNFLYSDITKLFPELTGRVVDKVNLLNPNFKIELENKLKKHEEETSNQIVVVILKSLNGYEISEYSYQLGRFWGIGQKNKNNGVLLLVSKEDKKIRIEVGYGLEGGLTDKISHEIVNYTLKPNFKKGNFEEGINKATEEIIQAIKGEYLNKSENNQSYKKDEINPFIYFIIIFISIIMTGSSAKVKNLFLYKISKSSLFSSFFAIFTYLISSDFTKYGFLISIIIFIIVFVYNFISTKKIDKPSTSTNNYSSYGSSGGFGSGGFSNSGSFGGGFSGGGGSFGGGGASGSW